MTLQEKNRQIQKDLESIRVEVIGDGIRAFHTGHPELYSLSVSFDEESSLPEWLDERTREIEEVLGDNGITEEMFATNGAMGPNHHEGKVFLTFWLNKDAVDATFPGPEPHTPA